MQAAFRDNHGLQCGYCTPGMIMSAVDIVHRYGGKLDEETVRHELEGNICRCTGYHNIVKSVLDAAGRMKVSQAAEYSADVQGRSTRLQDRRISMEMADIKNSGRENRNMGVEGIGASVVRKEDRRFITGKGRYVDDIKIQGMTHAHFIRSPARSRQGQEASIRQRR